MERHGSEETQYTLTINVEILAGGGYYQGGRLGVQERVELGPLGFLEMAQVLGRFHELAETIKKERSGLATRERETRK